MKIKRKFMAGFLAVLLLSSQLVLPCSALANNSQPTNQPITKPKDEPKKNKKENSITNPAKGPISNSSSNDKKSEVIKDNSKNELKTKNTQDKLKSELSDKSSNHLKAESLKELKSQDRSAALRYKHIKKAWVPKEIKASLGLLAVTMETSCDYIDMKGLKPNSKFYLLGESGNVLLEGTADSDGKAGVKDIYEYWRRNSIAFFEGDVIGNDLPKEEEVGSYDISVEAKLFGFSVKYAAGVYIEAYDENGKVLTSGVTDKYGKCRLHIELPIGTHKIIIKQVVAKSPKNIIYDLGKERSLDIDVRHKNDNQIDSTIMFSDTPLMSITFSDKQPTENLIAQIQFISLKDNQKSTLNVNLGDPIKFNKEIWLYGWTLEDIYNGQPYEIISQSPGYYIKKINGMDYEKRPLSLYDITSIDIGYRAAGEFEYNARIKIPNEKYSGCFEAGLVDEQGRAVVSAVNDENGNFNFDKIKYTEKDVGEHKYQTYIKLTDKGLTLKGTLGEIKLHNW